MLRPKQLDGIFLAKNKVDNGEKTSRSAYRRATLTIRLSGGKLLRTFPFVLSPKVRKPARAMARQAIMEMRVE